MRSEEHKEYSDINSRVIKWARINCPIDLDYGAPYSYYANAFYAGVITKEEFELAEKMKGNLWHYRGD